MSDGIKDALRISALVDNPLVQFIDRDSIDGLDENDYWELSLDEDTQEIKIDEKLWRGFRDPFPWLSPVCECGSWKTYGEKIPNNQHADYCPVKK